MKIKMSNDTGTVIDRNWIYLFGNCEEIYFTKVG